MRKKILMMGVVLTLGAVPGGTRAEEIIRLDAFAATVNTRVITVGDVRQAMEPLARRIRLDHGGQDLESRVRALFDETLARLIEREMMAAEFTRRELKLPERFVDAEIERLVSERFGGRRSAFLDAMAEDRLTLDRYRTQLAGELKAMLLYQQDVTRRIVVTPAALRAEYEENRDAHAVPERMRIRAIEFRGGAEEDRLLRAQAAQERITSGQAFPDVAREVSDGPQALEGGDWGWVAVSDLHPEVAGALSGLAPGGTTEAVSIEDRLFIVRLEEHEPGRQRSIEEVLPEIRARVRRQEELRLRDRLRAQLDRFHAVRLLASDEAG